MRIWLIVSVITYIITFAGIAWYFEKLKDSKEQYRFLAAFLFKMLCGLGVGALYYFYYQSGDTIKYFERALIMYEWLLHSDNLLYSLYQMMFHDIIPETLTLLLSKPRVFLMVKLVTITMFFVGPWYLSVSLFFSFFSFSGCWYFYRRIKSYAPDWEISAVVSLLFLPSFVFWSSGLLKDSLATAALMVLMGSLLTSRSDVNLQQRIVYVILLATFFGLLFQLKYYTAALFILSVASWKILSGLRNIFSGIPTPVLLLSSVFSLALVAGLLGLYHPNLHPQNVWHLLWTNYEMIVDASGPGAYLVLSSPDSFIEAVLLMIKATWSGLYAPLPWQAHESLSLLLSLENLALLVCSVLAGLMLFSSRMKPSLLVWHLVLYVMLSACLLAIASPNYGSLVRYSVAFRPFVWMMVLAVLTQNQVFRRLREKFEV